MKKLYAIIILFAGITCSYAQSHIVGYEYWFNDDFANKTTTIVTSAPQLLVSQNIPTTGLAEGINIFNFRSFDNAGKYSSVLSSFFYKTSALQDNTNPQIVAYEYWIDNDYANAVVVNVPAQPLVNINELISMSDLNNGIHTLNIRFKDNANLWSSVTSNFFYKIPQHVVVQNKITEYRYWFDNDFANAVQIFLPPNQQINLIDALDLTQLPKGTHEINFQFKDTLGMWSVVLADTIEKISLPIADFSYSAIQYCDSTVVTFTDNSIDGDEYLWDFGDGNTSNLVNPIYTYYTPSTYLVSLTVTDTILGIDSTLIIPIVINSLNSFASISETACDSYTAPDGAIYTTSGIKTAVIPNAAGCDSTITIDLTVNQSSENSISETACDSYTAPDGAIYTTSGIKTAVIPNAAGCDSTITIDLTIFNSTSSSITETTCDSYTAPDGAIYTTSGIKTAVIPNASGCDSTITIDLTVNQSSENSIIETACDSYTAPDGQVYTTSGIITAIIPNAAGCDSTITIDLTINTVDVSVTQNETILTSNATDALYQWLDCLNSYSIITGETSQSFNATQNGNYAVQVTQNNCIDTSDCYEVTTFDILESTFSNNITVYPNPTDGILKIDLGENLPDFVVSIIDVNGKLIRQTTYKNTKMFELNLNVQSGIYFLMINSENKKATIRLIKN